MDVRQLFAANLRRIRHERGFSQERLAYECEIDRAHVSKIERGLGYVGLGIIDKLAEVFDTARDRVVPWWRPVREVPVLPGARRPAALGSSISNLEKGPNPRTGDNRFSR